MTRRCPAPGCRTRTRRGRPTCTTHGSAGVSDETPVTVGDAETATSDRTDPIGDLIRTTLTAYTNGTITRTDVENILDRVIPHATQTR